MLSVVVMGDRTIEDFHLSMEVRSPLSYCPARVRRCPSRVLTWLAARLADVLPPRPPGVGGNPRCPWRSAWTSSPRCR